MIKLTQNSKTFGDATAMYSVEMTKPYTVGEFIEEVLTRDEWGSIGIFDEDQAWFQSGNPSCEYKRDELLSELPKDVQNEVVLKAEAHGGWSNMDYKLHLK